MKFILILPFRSAILSSICFIDDMTGFIAGSKIYKTTDGGMTWNDINTGVSLQSLFRIIFVTFILLTTIWALLLISNLTLVTELLKLLTVELRGIL